MCLKALDPVNIQRFLWHFKSRLKVPVLSRPMAKPSFSSDWPRAMLGLSPMRPAGLVSKPMLMLALRKVPVVMMIDLQLITCPLSEKRLYTAVLFLCQTQAVFTKDHAGHFWLGLLAVDALQYDVVHLLGQDSEIFCVEHELLHVSFVQDTVNLRSMALERQRSLKKDRFSSHFSSSRLTQTAGPFLKLSIL